MPRRVKIEENIIDKVFRYVAPVIAQKRFHARAAMSLAGSYTGASKRRRQTENWNTSAGDADTDTLYDLPELRERSRDLIRNTPLATGAINTKVTSVIGSGLKLRPQIDRTFLGLSDEDADQWEMNTEREFRLFALSNECSSCRNLNFYELQDLAFRSTLENGDTFALLPHIKRKNVPYDLAVNLVEADRVCNEDFKQDSKNLSGGIEKDQQGAPSRYHILNTHPGSLQNAEREWIKVPAFGAKSGRRNVVHLYRKLRIGQTRGVPDLAPVIELFKQLCDYTDAEVTAAVVSGLFTGFIKTTGNQGGSNPLGGTETGSKDTVKMGSGSIIELGEGEEIDFANPGRPNTAFDPFVQAVLRQIGVALELPFELLIKHFTASYSASRAALLEAFKFFNGRRKWMTAKFCMPIYEAFMDEAVSKGRIHAPGYLDGDPAIRAAYLGSEWRGDAKGHIQPLQEIKAEQVAVEMGAKTLDEVTAELTGGEWRKKHKQSAKENQMRIQDGLIEDPNKPVVQQVEPDEGEEDLPLDDEQEKANDDEDV